MTYNLILGAIVIIAVIVGTSLGKGGPRWKSPLIALMVFLVAITIVEFLGLNPGS